jgi:hypothetical protein
VSLVTPGVHSVTNGTGASHEPLSGLLIGKPSENMTLKLTQKRRLVVERKTDRLQLRISSSDRAQVQTTARSLGLTTSAFSRRSLLERVALEAALCRHDDERT